MPNLSILIKPVSGLCDMNCTYCFYRDEARNREQEFYGMMEETVLEEMIKKSLRYASGECTFAYQGGEPTLRGLDFYRKALFFQEKYNEKNIRIHNAIQTNGYGITEEWAKFFAENHFLVGVSLDGIKRTHDKYRKDPSGNATFEKIMRNIQILDRYRVEYNILTVVNKYTAKQIPRIYKFYKKQNFQYLQFIPCLDPIGELPGQREYSLTPEEYGMFLKELFDLWHEDVKQGCQPYIRQFENFGGMLIGLAPEACDQRGICGMQYVAEADGSVYPCDFYVLDDYRLGNFQTGEFEDFEKERQRIRFIEASTDFSDECKACEYFYLCRGGCRRHRIPQEADADISFFCQSYKMFFDYTIERWRELSRKIIENQEALSQSYKEQ